MTFYSIANGDTGERSEGIPASAQVLLPATADTLWTFINPAKLASDPEIDELRVEVWR